MVKWICNLIISDILVKSAFGRQSVSPNLQVLILDVKNTRSMASAAKTVKRLLPQSAGIRFFKRFICTTFKIFY